VRCERHHAPRLLQSPARGPTARQGYMITATVTRRLVARTPSFLHVLNVMPPSSSGEMCVLLHVAKPCMQPGPSSWYPWQPCPLSPPRCLLAQSCMSQCSDYYAPDPVCYHPHPPPTTLSGMASRFLSRVSTSCRVAASSSLMRGCLPRASASRPPITGRASGADRTAA
jgi:hypothetical protein